MKRRSFLRNSSLVGLPILINGVPVSAMSNNCLLDSIDDDNDNVIVLIQLNGGNDGLNTIIPLESYELLANVRSNIIIPENSIIPLDDQFGLHSSMEGIKRIYDNANLAVVMDAGYPNQNRSHFRSLDIWTSGSPAEEFWSTGWMGRYFENRHATFPEGFPNAEQPDPFAITMGSAVSETCQGTLANFSLALTDPFALSPLYEGSGMGVPDSPYGRELAFLRTSITQSNAYGSIVTEAAEKGNSLSQLYADNNLAGQLRNIAIMISGGLRSKVYVANLGGFDTHANQVDGSDTRTGDHASLINILSEAMEAFQDDLKLLGLDKKVITMTFSEFGRRIRSNDSLGTDHGTAAPLLIAGPCVNAGILGMSPDLPDNPTISDGVPMQHDFRDIYGSLLIDWFGVDETEVKKLLYDGFKYLPVVNACQTTLTDDPIVNEASVYTYPNPCKNWSTLGFNSVGDHYHLGIYDQRGRKVKLISDKYFGEGKTEIKIDLHNLSSGTYFVRIENSYGFIGKKLIKI